MNTNIEFYNDGEALTILKQSNDISIEAGLIKIPKRILSSIEIIAINYLCSEWDYCV